MCRSQKIAGPHNSLAYLGCGEYQLCSIRGKVLER